MIQRHAQHDAQRAASELAARCEQIGLPLWRFDDAGRLVYEPIGTSVVAMWLRAPALRRMLHTQVDAWTDDAKPAPSELFEGCWVIPLVRSRRRRRECYDVVLVLSPQAVASEHFLAVCQSASIDTTLARSMVGTIATHDVRSVPTLAALLGWLHEDSGALSAQGQDVEVFSTQLAESYEETNLLYTLGQSMNELAHPERFVATACEELHAALHFEWIGACFAPEAGEAGALGGGVFVAGKPPIERAQLIDCTADLLQSVEAGSRVVMPGDALGAALGGSRHVLLHPIKRESGVVGVLFAGEKRGDDPDVTSNELKMMESAAGFIGVLLENAALYEKQQAMFLGTIGALTASIDAKDPYTRGHSERVAHLSYRLALALGIPSEQAWRIRIGGLVHDIGKIGVPEAVLCKPGKLTDTEFAQIKRHPEIGHRILRDIPQLDDIRPGVLHHHERYDGRGYPEGLQGDEIPSIARIIGLADAFDAMSSTRTYRCALSRDQVIDEIRNGAGTQFDPACAEAFMAVDLATFDDLVRRHQSDDKDATGEGLEDAA